MHCLAVVYYALLQTTPHPPKYEKLNKMTFESRKFDLLNFRKYEYRVSESSESEVEITRHLPSGETLV